MLTVRLMGMSLDGQIDILTLWWHKFGFLLIVSTKFHSHTYIFVEIFHTEPQMSTSWWQQKISTVSWVHPLGIFQTGPMW